VTGCGSDDSHGADSTPFASGIPGDKTFDGLSDADVTNLCASLGKYLSTDPGLREATCHFAGFGIALSAGLFGATSDADLQKMCTDTEARCKDTPWESTQSTCSKPTSACNATVGEFEACVTDFIDAATQAFATLPACSSITNASLKMLGSGGNGGMPMAEAPPSCKALEQKCPGIQDSTGLSSVNDSSAP
jgi:hypothetical protein